MLKSDRYSVWYKANRAAGLGIVTMKDGCVRGGDTMVKYEGTYTENGDEFRVSLRTKRFAPGRLPLFQIDELNIELRGNSSGGLPMATGSVKQVPGVLFEVILLPIVEDAPQVDSAEHSLHLP